jgi:hypothetical protein
MSNPFDVLGSLTPEQAAAWKAQFGTPPTDVQALNSYADRMAQMPTASGPEPIAPTTPSGPSPADIADLQNYGNRMAAMPTATRAAPVGPPVQASALPASTDIADLRAYADRMAQMPQDTRAPAVIDNDTQAPSPLGMYRNKDYDLLAAGAPEGKGAAQLGGAESASAADEGAAYTAAREARARARENGKRIQSGQPTIEEEARIKARQKAVKSGDVHATAAALIPVMDEDVQPRALQELPQNLSDVQRRPVAPSALLGGISDLDQMQAVGERAGDNPGSTIGDPRATPGLVERGTGSLPYEAGRVFAHPSTIPGGIVKMGNEARKDLRDLGAGAVDVTKNPKLLPQKIDAIKQRLAALDPGVHKLLPGAPNLGGGGGTNVPATARDAGGNVGADAGDEGEPSIGPGGFNPMTVIPGGRTPAMWQTKYGTPVSDEDQDALLQARWGQQAAVDQQGEADIGIAQAKANDLATQQKAVGDLAALQQQRQQRLLDAKQAQVTKLQGMVDDIRSRKIDDSNVFAIPGAAGKFFSGIGVAIGAGVQARLGLHQNPSLEIVKNLVEKNMQQQRLKMEQGKDALGAQSSLLGQMQTQFGDQQLADQATKMALMERAKLHAEEVAQTSSVPRIRANAGALAAAIGEQNAKDKIGFDQAAANHVIQRDVMTKPQVFGGAPTGVNGGAAADSDRQVVIPEDLGGPNVGNQRWIATSAKSADALRNTVEAAATIHSAYQEIAQLEKDHGQTIYSEDSPAGARARALINATLGKVGALQGQSKLPIVDVELWKHNLAPEGFISKLGGATGLGATLTERMKNFDDIGKREMMTKLRVHASEQGRRHVTVGPGGVAPGVHYTGESADKPKLPASAKPVPGMPYTPPGRQLNYKPEVRVGTPSTGKGKNKKPGTETVVESEADEPDDNEGSSE